MSNKLVDLSGIIPDGATIGCVPYFNAMPLCGGLEKVSLKLASPSELTRRFERGEFSAALLPVYDILRLGITRVVEGVSIACAGPVQSVFVAHRTPLDEVKKIWLHADSASSIALWRVLWGECQFPAAEEEFFQSPQEMELASQVDANEAILLIGNPALRFRQEQGDAFSYWDLGEVWWKAAELPFTFALWALAEDAPQPDHLAQGLRMAAVEGWMRRHELAEDQDLFSPPRALDYLENSLRYYWGEEERRGVDHFMNLLERRGVLPRRTPPTSLQWVLH